MKEADFIFQTKEMLPEGTITQKAPSNIALIKYWGKEELQIPKNSSLSFSLQACFTLTELQYSPVSQEDNISFQVFYNNEIQEAFRPKIAAFFKRVAKYVPFIKNYSFCIKTRNSFPHSSGIASSASGMAAFALCIMQMEKRLNPSMTDLYFEKKASFLARLGSGSAARSIERNIVVWGEHEEIPGSSNLYGVPFPYPVHPIFKNFHDTILLIDKGKKQVSSTLGHQLLVEHPFAVQRFKQASQNLSKLIKVLQNGDLQTFIRIVESEALTLHAMMLTGKPYFILMQPNTLAVIHKIWAFRKATNFPICFTLDAGANVHILYPEKEKEEINRFIKRELLLFCENNQYICDKLAKVEAT